MSIFHAGWWRTFHINSILMFKFSCNSGQMPHRPQMEYSTTRCTNRHENRSPNAIICVPLDSLFSSFDYVSLKGICGNYYSYAYIARWDIYPSEVSVTLTAAVEFVDWDASWSRRGPVGPPIPVPSFLRTLLFFDSIFSYNPPLPSSFPSPPPSSSRTFSSVSNRNLMKKFSDNNFLDPKVAEYKSGGQKEFLYLILTIFFPQWKSREQGRDYGNLWNWWSEFIHGGRAEFF